VIGPLVVELVNESLQDWQLVLDGPVQERHSLEHGCQMTSATGEKGEFAALLKYAGGRGVPSSTQNSCREEARLTGVIDV
jgi:hypothetical protein